MDIQKEKEAFETWWESFHNGRQIACDYVEEDNSYCIGYANAQWVAWQAAKADALNQPNQMTISFDRFEELMGKAVNAASKTVAVVPEGFVLVPKESLKVALFWMNEDIDPWQMGNDSFADLFEHKPILEKVLIEAQEPANE